MIVLASRISPVGDEPADVGQRHRLDRHVLPPLPWPPRAVARREVESDVDVGQLVENPGEL